LIAVIAAINEQEKIMSIQQARSMVMLLAVTVLVSSAAADMILVDFGNDSSFRGANQTGLDANGNTWNSVWSGAFYSGLLNTAGDATTINFGFSSEAGTDSFNGPAGVTTEPITQTQIDSVDIDAPALGLLGGSRAAAFDFYVSSTFQIQNLDPLLTYNLTFFGSHKFNTDNSTRYTVYTDNTFSVPLLFADLVVGVGNAHNRDTTVTLAGISPQIGNTLYVGFDGSDGISSGYLNALQIEVVPEPTIFSMMLLGGLALRFIRRRAHA
jgi:hypothetical protein